MELSIDAAACSGHGRCWVVAPELFESDEAGAGVVKQATISADQLVAARRAVDSCPESAIVLKES